MMDGPTISYSLTLMSDTVLLYVIFGVMLLAAVLMLIPTFARAVRSTTTVEDDRADFLKAQLREEARRLEAEYRAGEHTEENYRALREDLERRAVSEMKELHATQAVASTVSIRNTMIGVIALMICVPVMCYQLLGAPEVMLLVKDQQVFQGEAQDVDQIRAYLKVNEKDGRAWVLLARRAVEKEDYATALDAYRKGREVNAKVAADPEVMLELVATILTVNDPKDFPEAKSLVKAAVDANPENLRAVEVAAITMLTAEDWKGALPYLETMMAHAAPDTPQYLRLEGLLRDTRARAGL